MATRSTLGPSLLAAFHLLAGPAAAQSTDRNVAVGIVLQESSGLLRCQDLEPMTCGSGGAVVAGTLFQEYYALLCVFGGDDEKGVAGLVLGVEYNGSLQSGVDVLDWTLCADLEYPSDGWPASRTGNLITWEPSQNCQMDLPGDPGDGVTAIAGWFRVTAYSPDRIAVTEHTKRLVPPVLQYANCEGAQFDLNVTQQAGSAGFSDNGSEKGNLPCFQRVEEETTWGRIKSTYGN